MKPKKYEPLLIWIFGTIGGMLIQFMMWFQTIISSAINPISTISVYMGWTIAIGFSILGLLFASRVVHMYHPSKLTEKIVQVTAPVLENSRWPLKAKSPKISEEVT